MTSDAHRVSTCLGPDLLWRDLRVERFERPTPAVFLDRDGVIIEEKCYLSDPAQVELLPGAAALIRRAHACGLAVVQVTNQAGIGRGRCGWLEFAAVEDRLTELLAGLGARVDAVFAWPFHAEGQTPIGRAITLGGSRGLACCSRLPACSISMQAGRC